MPPRAKTTKAKASPSVATEPPPVQAVQTPPPEKLGRVDQASVASSNATVIGTGLALATALVLATIWIVDRIDESADKLSTRMGSVESTLAKHGEAIDALSKRIDGIDDRLDRMDGRLDRMDSRMDRFEERMNAKFGADDQLDGGVDAGRVWSEDHVKLREKTCMDLCARGASMKGSPAAGPSERCLGLCAADFNACGIRCPMAPGSDCFKECVGGLEQNFVFFPK